MDLLVALTDNQASTFEESISIDEAQFIEFMKRNPILRIIMWV